MINFVRFETENLSQSATNLIQKQHSFESVLTWVLASWMASSKHNWVEVVVSKLSSLVTFQIWVVAKHSSVRIPFSDSWAVRNYSFLSMGPHFRSEAFGYWQAQFWVGLGGRVNSILANGLIPKKIWSIGFLCDGTDTAKDRISVEKSDSVINWFINFTIVLGHKFSRVLG